MPFKRAFVGSVTQEYFLYSRLDVLYLFHTLILHLFKEYLNIAQLLLICTDIL